VVANARLAAKVARLGKAKGILLDTEAYNQPLFHYRRQVNSSQRSWQAYSRQVQARGREIMRAFQKEFPEVRVFLTFGYEMPWVRCVAKGITLADCDYGLLAPFLDGMVEAANGKSRIINGYEFAYYFREPSEFSEAYFTSKNIVQLIIADPRKYLRVFSFSFGLWMDANWRETDWHTDDPSRNFYTPEQFETNVRNAWKKADEYVWIYTEQPRWWSEPNGTKSRIPNSYINGLERAIGVMADPGRAGL
jgi:hypothetical protein